MADQEDIFDHPMTNHTDLEDTVNEVAQATASRLRSAARYIREADASQIVADLEALVQQHPGPALCIAVILGVIVGRSVHSTD